MLPSLHHPFDSFAVRWQQRSSSAAGSPLALGGWLLSTQVLSPKFSRLNPISGLGKIFSIQGPIALGMSILKTLVVGGLAGWAMWIRKDQVLGLVTKPLSLALADAMHLLVVCCGTAIAGLFLVAAVDVPYQLFSHAKKLRMSKEEVKREHRESDGDPAVKARIRAQQRAAARRRMMTSVPTADVIVTNPTHFAVALKYADGEMRAPRVVAKGVNLVAARIRELALELRPPRRFGTVRVRVRFDTTWSRSATSSRSVSAFRLVVGPRLDHETAHEPEQPGSARHQNERQGDVALRSGSEEIVHGATIPPARCGRITRSR